jgi:hypothetical protein
MLKALCHWIIPLLAMSGLIAPVQAHSSEDHSSADHNSADHSSADEEEQPLWEVRLAAFGRYGPSYPASEESQFNFIPLPFPIYRGRFLRLGDDTEKPIQGRVFRTDQFQLNIDFDLNFGSDADDIDARTGMSDLDFLLEAGPELIMPFMDSDLTRGHLELALQLRGAFSFDGLDPSWRGVVFNPELRWIRPLKQKNQELKIRLTPAFASNDYMDYYYGVAPEFATPLRPAYAAKGGYLGTELSITLRQPLTRKLEIWSGVRLGYHGGAKNEDSPLFTQKTTASVYAAFMYKFWESKNRTSAD